MRFLILFLLGGVLFAACDQSPEKSQAQKYYNLDSLVSEQVQLLARSGAKLKKKALINAREEEETLEPDSLMWENELSILREIDLNKPIYQTRYSIKDGLSDRFSNLKIREYTALDSKLDIRYLKIYYLGNISRLKKIETSFRSKNPLFYTQKQVKAEFEEIRGKPVLSGYKFLETQKLIFLDTLRFKLYSQVFL